MQILEPSLKLGNDFLVKLKDLSISVTEAKQEERFNELIKFFD